MTSLLKVTLVTLGATTCIAAVLEGVARTAGPADLSGTWTMTVKGPAAHGDLTATLLLTHKAETVDGTFSAHGHEHTVSGSFENDTLTLETTDTPSDRRLSFTARLRDDGSLAGDLSGPMGDMGWAAMRARKER